MATETDASSMPTPIGDNAPQISIIAVLYNQDKYLPSLLDNIQEQSIKDIEVVLVDDCSQTPSEELLASPKYATMNIKYMQNDKRLYLKDSYLKGMKSARGDLVLFLDPSDQLFKKTALEYHVKKILESDADILQFRTQTIDDAAAYTAPIADTLHGNDIFRKYVESSCGDQTLFGKIIRRSVLMECASLAKSIVKTPCPDNLLLVSLLYFNAKSYIWSDRIGSIQQSKTYEFTDLLGEMATCYYMIKELIPCLVDRGVDDDVVEKFRSFLFNKIQTVLAIVQKFCVVRSAPFDFASSVDRAIAQLPPYVDHETFLRIILTCLIHVRRTAQTQS
ncbi:MAG: glycosyltransferase [Desulfovibrio sp.]|jgi:hypothetical protein|nr:glycosyltransferase [Desulfovibrio sp.]